MESRTLSKNSWHLWLANWGSRRIRTDEGTDICAYIRAVIMGTINMILASLLTAIVLGGVVFTLGAGLVFYVKCLFLGIPAEVNDVEFLGAIFDAILLVMGLMRLAYDRIDAYLDKRPVANTPPGFVALAKEKFKNKTCFRIDFE